jgi:hypothetical protein
MGDLYDFKTGEKILPEANNIPVAQRISKGLQ